MSCNLWLKPTPQPSIPLGDHSALASSTTAAG